MEAGNLLESSGNSAQAENWKLKTENWHQPDEVRQLTERSRAGATMQVLSFHSPSTIPNAALHFFQMPIDTAGEGIDLIAALKQ